MKKKKYFCICLSAAIAALFAMCTYDEWQSPENEIPESAISVKEAKAFFEEQMMFMGETNDGKELHGFATNFTPQWNKAVINGRDSMVSVDVPIITDFMFKAVIYENDTAKTEKFATDLLQKLIVVKDIRTGSIGSYVVSIIPDETYVQSKRQLSAMDFTNYGDYGNFSGLMIYSLPLSSLPLRVNRYRDGILTDAASVFEVLDNPAALQEVSDKMQELLYGFRLKRKARISLRDWEFDGKAWSGNGCYCGDELFINSDKGNSSISDLLNNLQNWLDMIDHGNNGNNVIDPFGDYGGAGGYGYVGGTNNDPKTPQTRTDCLPKAAQNSSNVINIMNDVNTNYQKVQPLIKELRDFAKMSTNEYGLAVNYLDGQYYVFDTERNPSKPHYINSGTPNSVEIPITKNTVITVHTHPSGSYPAPSALDAIFLAKNYKDGYNNIRANVEIAADGSEYMVYIDDVSKLNSFCNNPNNSGFFEKDGAYFNQGSIWRTEYESAYNQLKTQGYSNNDAQSYALDYALRDTGMKIYQKKNNEFKEQKTEKKDNNYTPKICP